MKTEIEAKFCDVNHDEVRAKLQALGGKQVHPMTMMHRQILDFPDKRLHRENAWLRLRDEGHKITLTFKKLNGERAVDAVEETEIVVSDYEVTSQLLTSLGLEVLSSQESKRETWEIDGVEVVLDEWPWLKPYIEIEADSVEAVKKVAAELGFAWETAVFGDVTEAYKQQYEVSLNLIKQAKMNFENPRPDWLKPKVS